MSIWFFQKDVWTRLVHTSSWAVSFIKLWTHKRNKRNLRIEHEKRLDLSKQNSDNNFSLTTRSWKKKSIMNIFHESNIKLHSMYLNCMKYLIQSLQTVALIWATLACYLIYYGHRKCTHIVGTIMAVICDDKHILWTSFQLTEWKQENGNWMIDRRTRLKEDKCRAWQTSR